MDHEKLGAFYLGRIHDLDAGRTTDELLLYDAKDLTTHAVCVGMTGSGKTGLCVGILEEAAIDGIPAIAIDVKGDLGALFGRKVASVGTVGRASSAMRRVGSASKEKDDIRRAQESLASLEQRLADLEAEFREQTAELQTRWDPQALEIEETPVPPRKSDISIGRVVLAWRPFGVSPEGIAEPAD